MLRITPEMVLEAYENTGLTPMQGDYFPDVGCACALGALSVYNGAKSDEDTEEYCKSAYDEHYFRSFACGFDGDNNGFHDETGYQDGKDAWEAVKKLGESS